MESTQIAGISALSETEKKEIQGGWLGKALVAMYLFHVIRESVNDWESHEDAFNRGRAAAS